MKWTKEEEQEHLDYYDKHGAYMVSPHRSADAVRKKMKILLANRKPLLKEELAEYIKKRNSGACFYLDAIQFHVETGYPLVDIIRTREYEDFMPTASREFMIEGVRNNTLNGLAVSSFLFGPEQ